jgi:hypothetical protein
MRVVPADDPPAIAASLKSKRARISAPAVVALLAYALLQLPAIFAHDFGSVVAMATVLMACWAFAHDVIERDVDEG